MGRAVVSGGVARSTITAPTVLIRPASQNSAFSPTASASRPPTSGPSSIPLAYTAWKTPIAVARSADGTARILWLIRLVCKRPRARPAMLCVTMRRGNAAVCWRPMPSASAGTNGITAVIAALSRKLAVVGPRKPRRFTMVGARNCAAISDKTLTAVSSPRSARLAPSSWAAKTGVKP